MEIEEVLRVADTLGATNDGLDEIGFTYTVMFGGNRPYWIHVDSSGQVIGGQKLFVIFEIFSYVYANHTDRFFWCDQEEESEFEN